MRLFRVIAVMELLNGDHYICAYLPAFINKLMHDYDVSDIRL